MNTRRAFMRNRVLLSSVAVLTALIGCSKTGDRETPAQTNGAQSTPAQQEVVDAGKFFKDVPSYEGRKVYLYLDRVAATGPDPARKSAVDSMDTRAMSSYGFLTLSEGALKKWTAMGLDPEREYTVTFGVRATDATGGKKAIYDIVAEDFTVNYDGGARYGQIAAPRQLGANGLPVGEIKLPVPMTVKDPRQLELFPAQYKDKLVRVSRRFMKDRVTPHDDKYLLIDSEGTLKFLVKKELVEPSFSTWPTVSAVEIVGKVVTDGAQTAVMGEEVILLK